MDELLFSGVIVEGYHAPQDVLVRDGQLLRLPSS